MEIKKEIREQEVPAQENEEALSPAEQQRALDALAVTIKENMKKIFMEGMTTGGQGYVSVIYDLIKKETAEYCSAEEILADVEMMCRSLLEIPDEAEYSEGEEEAQAMTFVLGTVKAVPGIQ